MGTLLSSDVLEKQFGETNITILKQNEKYRIIKTISTVNNEVLELSLVTFDQLNTHAFPEIHAAITAGSSMGKAYRQAGVQFNRKITGFNRISLPNSLASYFSAKGTATIIEVAILVGPDQIRYCHIFEIYSPIVKWPQLSRVR